jgi:hypothetical protein
MASEKNTMIKNPYLRSFPPSPARVCFPPREEEKVVPSYADPEKIRKYEAIEAIFGERPLYVMQKKRRYEQTVWIKDHDIDVTDLDVLGTSRTYYPKARWTKPPNFCTCPCEPKSQESYRDFKTFSDEAWSSDDDDFSETYYNARNELMCVRHERTGKILNAGETIVPGVGVVTLSQDVHTAAQTGRIFPSADKIFETSFDPDLHSVDFYAVDEKKAKEAKGRNLDRLEKFCRDEGLSWPPKKIPVVLLKQESESIGKNWWLF